MVIERRTVAGGSLVQNDRSIEGSQHEQARFCAPRTCSYCLVAGVLYCRVLTLLLLVVEIHHDAEKPVLTLITVCRSNAAKNIGDADLIPLS